MNTASAWAIVSDFHDRSIVSRKSRYMYRMIMKATEIELHVKEDILCLSRSWKPLIHSLKVVETPCHRSDPTVLLRTKPAPVSSFHPRPPPRNFSASSQ
jgi:hypothetical protein